MHRCIHCVWIIQQTFTVLHLGLAHVQLTKVFWDETKTELELYPYTIEIEHHWHCTTAKFNPYLLIRLLYCGGTAAVIADAPLAGSLLRETKFEGVHFESILHINICHSSRISLQ